MLLKMIDISSWQHPNNTAIDFRKVAASGVHGVVIKATQGTWYTNPDFADDAADADQAGLLVGAYHFAEPGRSTPDDQALYFHSVIAGHELGLGVWLDLEETGGLMWHDLQAWAETWVNGMDTPQTPSGLYVNMTYATSLTGTSQFRRLWLANPSNAPGTFSPVMVQTGQAEIPGITGAVDVDEWQNSRILNPPGGGGNPLPVPAPPVVPPPVEPVETQLQQGDKGTEVLHVQTLLNAKGAKLALDSDFGPATHEAVLSFQWENGLAADGVVGVDTWAGLRTASDKPVDPVPGAETAVGEGASGPAVVLMQRLLNETGAGLTVDGVFGPVTRSHVVAFQLAHSLTPDGECGPLTWTALRNAT